MGLDHSKIKSYVHNTLNKEERFEINSIRNFQLNKFIEPWVYINHYQTIYTCFKLNISFNFNYRNSTYLMYHLMGKNFFLRLLKN